ncbi:MAG TPA: C1 family peptidase [Reyranella sp.]
MTTDNELHPSHHHHHHHGGYESGQLATQWDWRKVDGRNYITPSQDQGVCQASTAFAITDAMNAKLRVEFSIPVGDARQILFPDLSAADLFYCGGGSCSEGQDVEQALGYAKDKGVVPAYNIPYKPTGQTCGRGPAELEARVTRISGFITQRSRASMQDAIQSRGPIIAVLRAYQDLKNYKGGVYRYDGKSPFLYNQTVCVIGFTPDGWLCKNSWGPNWGTGGVFLIAYGECGIDDEWMWEIGGFFVTYPFATVVGTAAAAGKGPLRIFYRDNYSTIQYLSAYPPSAIQPVPLDGLAAGSDPTIGGDDKGQIHVIRTDILGNIQHNVWNNSWSKVQWLTGPEGLTEAPPAVGNPSTVGGPYVLYRDAGGNIHNVYVQGGQWKWQQVTGGAGLKVPAAAGDPKLSEFVGNLHVCYRNTDGNIQDLEYTGSKWSVKQITGNPPPVVGDPFVTVYNTVLRILYRDKDGKVVHLMHNPAGDKWSWEYLPVPAAVVAAGDPVATDYGGSLHLFYRESRGFIWHLYWYGGRWNGEQLTGPGLSGGELAEGDPKAVSFGNEIHVLYRDIYDNLSDAYWTGTTWTHLVRI